MQASKTKDCNSHKQIQKDYRQNIFYLLCKSIIRQFLVWTGIDVKRASSYNTGRCQHGKCSEWNRNNDCKNSNDLFNDFYFQKNITSSQCLYHLKMGSMKQIKSKYKTPQT